MMIDADEMKTRCTAIRLQHYELASAAGYNPNTVRYVFRGHGRAITAKLIGEALVREELRLRDYLLQLHPVKAEEAAA